MDSKRKKICIFLGSRANYSSLWPIMREIKQDSDLELLLFVGASALLDKYGEVVQDVQKDGFSVDEYVFMLLEGGTPITMVKSTGLGIADFAPLLYKHKPDYVLVIGDRFEMLSVTIAAAFMNIPVVHTMGGEVSGTIDESIRHAITKLAHLHFPATELAKQNIIRMGENPAHVFNFGCPRIDAVKAFLERGYTDELSNFTSTEGIGDVFDINEPFLLISQHPVTTEYGSGESQINETLEAVHAVQEEHDILAVLLWPNADAGTEDIARGIRKIREKHALKRFHAFKNFPLPLYVHLMDKTVCLVGNSSSGIRESAFIGTPVVNIGTRQQGREHGKNVLTVPYERNAIREAILGQMKQRKYPRETIYGDGTASKKIVSAIKNTNVSVQKKLHY